MNRRVLRTVGIAVIVIPEPTFITDIVGLIIVGASFLMPQGREFDSCRLTHHTWTWNSEQTLYKQRYSWQFETGSQKMVYWTRLAT